MDAGNQPMARNTQRPRRTANNHSSKVAYRKGRIMSIPPKHANEIYREAVAAKIKQYHKLDFVPETYKLSPASPMESIKELNEIMKKIQYKTKKEKSCTTGQGQ